MGAGSKRLGFKAPQDAVGKTVKSELFAPEDGMVNINVIGVVGDSRFRTVRTPIEPIMFRKVTAGPGWLMVRYRGDPATVKAAIERQWKQFTNEVPFNAKFSEDIMADGEAGPLTRYGVDPVAERQFIPHRMQILTDFLRNGTPPVHSQ